MKAQAGSSGKGKGSRSQSTPYLDARKSAAAKPKYKSVHSEVKRAVSKTLGAEGPKKSVKGPVRGGPATGKGTPAKKRSK